MNNSIRTNNEPVANSQIINEMLNLYKFLYNVIDRNFDRRKLSRFFPMKGKYYMGDTQLAHAVSDIRTESDISDARLMVVGRSVNGWTELTEKTSDEFSVSAIDAITCDGFSWLRDDGKGKNTYIRERDQKECRYNINRSSFFRCTQKILQELNPITKNCNRWFEYIVWSNLYTVAPLHSGNAEGALQYLQLDISRELLKLQIEYFNPTHILFITDWNYWFENFSTDSPEIKKTGDSITENVVGAGQYNGRKIVVTVRPDRTKPTKPIEESFVKDVVNAYKDI